MRTIWKGAISFGLVHVPVKMYPAVERKDISFSMLHGKCGNQVKYKKFCPVCGTDVPPEEIVRGYEYENGKFAVINDDELDNLPLKTTHAIDILDFVNIAEVDPVFFEKPYYLAPAEGGQKAFELLKRSMEKTGKAAVSKVVIRSRESLAALRAYNGAIILHTMHYPDEIRSLAGITELNYKADIRDNELAMANNLIESLTADFSPEKYTDEYRDALRKLIENKIAGQQVKIPDKPEAANVIDLMEALQQSIKIAGKNREAASNSRAGSSRRKARVKSHVR